MARWLKYSIIPAAAAFAALFAVLPPTGTGRKVSMVAAAGSYRFRPAAVRVDAGGAVTFFNDSKVTHTATCDGCPWDTGDLFPGQLRTLRFDRALAVRFSCRYHGEGGMRGTLAVGRATAPPAPAATPTPGQ